MQGFKHFFAQPPLHGRLTVRGIGVQEHMPQSIIDRPRGTGDHLFMLFYDPVFIASRGTPVLHPSGTLMIWTPGRWQYYGHRGGPYNHTWIHCDGPFVRSELTRLRIPRNRPVPIVDPTSMERYLLALHEELTRHVEPDPVIAANLLQSWLRDLARTLRGEKQAATVPREFLALRRELETHCAQSVGLADLADRVHLSVPHFCARFKQYFGTPAIDYLIRVRLHQAVYWLRDRNLNISEVARRVGYEDLFHFSKLFKKHYGVSPREMRQGWERGTSASKG
jgi:AraC-like DNA-binding protein